MHSQFKLKKYESSNSTIMRSAGSKALNNLITGDLYKI